MNQYFSHLWRTICINCDPFASIGGIWRPLVPCNDHFHTPYTVTTIYCHSPYTITPIHFHSNKPLNSLIFIIFKPLNPFIVIVFTPFKSFIFIAFTHFYTPSANSIGTSRHGLSGSTSSSILLAHIFIACPGQHRHLHHWYIFS